MGEQSPQSFTETKHEPSEQSIGPRKLDIMWELVELEQEWFPALLRLQFEAKVPESVMAHLHRQSSKWMRLVQKAAQISDDELDWFNKNKR